MTNLERIHQMDSKDMAAFLARHIGDEHLCFFCGRDGKNGCSVGSCRSRSAEDIIKEWLDKELHRKIYRSSPILCTNCGCWLTFDRTPRIAKCSRCWTDNIIGGDSDE